MTSKFRMIISTVQFAQAVYILKILKVDCHLQAHDLKKLSYFLREIHAFGSTTYSQRNHTAF